ncbi:MAG: DNA polymerase Y family protein [Planctomycetaceae bacterium]
MKRVLCVWLPNFPLQRLLCERPELKLAACVLYTESGNRAQVVMASREAKCSGIRAGMSLAEAQALSESAVFLLHHPESDALALQTLACLCCRYSPVVGLEQSDAPGATTRCLVLDIAGCAHLFGSEAGLARQLIADLAEQSYFAHVAIANTIGSAWGIARYGHRIGPDRRLRSLPVEALRVPDKLVNRLHEFDLRMIGQLRALPRESLPSRFGTVLMERMDQMFGLQEELLVPVPHSKPVSAEWETDEPICHPKAIRYVCEDLLTEILSALDSRRQGLLQLTLILESETSDPVSFEMGLTQPTNSAQHVMNLLDLKLETQSLPEWLTAIRMEASVIASLRVRQQQLFDHDKPDDTDIRKLIDRLSARLGRHAVVRPKLLPEVVPEQTVAYEPLAGSVSGTRSTDSAAAFIRPLELFPNPEPIRVISAIPDGPPVRFHWNQQDHQIAFATEPERIATAWWQDEGSIRRDYYQVETQNGGQFWLYRNGDGHWFLHGLFD